MNRLPIHRLLAAGAALLALATGSPAFGEQKVLIDNHEVHYIVLPTTFLKAEIARQYGIARSKDRALVNVSVLDPDGEPTTVQTVAGNTRNLLGQLQALRFRLVREQDAVYYLAELKHADEEHHRLEIEVALDSGARDTIKHSQKLYWEE